MSLRSQFLDFDDSLASLGVPPCTLWWRSGIGAWLDAYEQGKVLELWACVGRGAAKSTALYKLALFFTLFGDFGIPPGERHYAIVLSARKEEAAKGISIIARYLTLLGVKHRVAGDVIDLDGMPRGIRVAAASVAASSGWRAYFVGKDERSKWSTGGAEDLDAEEIDTSASAMTATHALAPVVSFGSAWGAQGGFYDAIASGTDARKVVLGPTPTWIAAPHIREEDTRRKERDPRRWAREYACEFQSGLLSAFDSDAVERAFREVPPAAQFMTGQRVLIFDASSGRKDSWTWAAVSWLIPPSTQYRMRLEYKGSGFGHMWEYALDEKNERIALEIEERFLPTLRFEAIGGIEGAFWKTVSGAQAVAKMVATCNALGITHLIGDQREALMLDSEIRRQGCRFTSIPYTSPNKTLAVETVRRWLTDEQIILPPHDKLKRELLSFEEKVMPSGALTFGARGGAHDDFACLTLTAAMANAAGFLEMSPVTRTVTRDLRLLPQQ